MRSTKYNQQLALIAAGLTLVAALSATAALGQTPGATQAAPDGAALFAHNCSGCHGADASGAGRLVPPLAGNPDLFLAPDFPLLVVLHGMAGPITVNGTDYNGVMPTFGILSDAEIAAVIAYVRSNFGNTPPADFPAATEADVAADRAGTVNTPAAVHAYRDGLI